MSHRGFTDARTAPLVRVGALQSLLPKPEDPGQDVSFWELLNLSRTIERKSLRVALIIFFTCYTTSAFVRFAPGDEIWPRAALIAYAGLGAMFCMRFTLIQVRAYAMGVAVLLPVLSARVTSVSDPGMNGVFLTGVMVLAPMPFLVIARDVIVTVPLIALGLWLVPTPTSGIDLGTAWTVWGTMIAVGTGMALTTIAHRNKSELAQHALEKAHARAVEATRAKSAFLAQMSHEIRTPMNGVLGMTEMLRREVHTEEGKRYVSVLRNSANTLLALLNDILDSSKIESGHLELESVPFSPVELVQGSADLFQPTAEQTGVALTSRVKGDVPPAVLGDPTRVRQALTNLVSNALKFTEKGSVTIELQAAAGQDARCKLRFAVSDTGIGIPKEKQREIFHAFTQADGSITRRFGGSGLGLSITQRLIELMGSRIELESEEGVGSTFHFTLELPRSADAGSMRQTSIPAPAQSMRVLVVDDDAVNCFVAEAILQSLGHDPSSASSGAQALQVLEEDVFDVVLLDLHMPEMDGLETFRRIRQHPEERVRTLAVIALTADAMTDQKAACDEAGMSGFLAKPFEKEELARMLERAVLHRSAA